MYVSPIQLICEAAKAQFDGEVFKVVQSADIAVDKDELLKALNYDRMQYEAGYKDGQAAAKREIIQCKVCQNSDGGFTCAVGRGSMLDGFATFPDEFCSSGILKDENGGQE